MSEKKVETMSLMEFLETYSKPATWILPHQRDVLEKISMRKISINMILHCPHCGVQHIDRPDPVPTDAPAPDFTKMQPGDVVDFSGADQVWTNPPHRTHICLLNDGGCGRMFTPAKIYTNGVREL